jgi:hypothetical protein
MRTFWRGYSLFLVMVSGSFLVNHMGQWRWYPLVLLTCLCAAHWWSA